MAFKILSVILLLSIVGLVSTYVYSFRTSQLVHRPVLSMSSVDTKSSGAVTVLRCDGLSKAYTAAPQFENISFLLGKGERVGLIG